MLNMRPVNIQLASFAGLKCDVLPHCHFFSRTSAFVGFMRDIVVHLVWIGTHCARTLWGDNRSTSWLASLTREVEVLQSELHRTQRVLNGYGTLLERCEKGHRFQAFGNSCFFGILLLLTIILFCSWCRGRRPAQPLRLTAADSSSSDEQTSYNQPVVGLQTGPHRPSTLGRGKR